MQIYNMENEKHEQIAGAACGAIAFFIWGLSPLYWKVLKTVPALEVIMHRVVWSFVFLFPIIFIQGKWEEFVKVLKKPRILIILLFTAFFVAFNWLIYIWSVNNGHIIEASLGYYINPLVNVLLGVIFLKERLRVFQLIAVIFACAGVLCLTFYYGKFPWVSLTLAFSFGFYGLIRKVVSVGSLTGLCIETLLLSVPAGVYLIYLQFHDTGAFLNNGAVIDTFLAGSALVTALPLLLFILGTKRLNLSTIGFLQYIAPTCMFLLGVFVYNEPFSRVQVITFSLIWTALGIYSFDSMINYKKMQKKSGLI
ncbi:DMT superfamily transporter [Desulfonema limicola]|uniref:DMT superfamily transporter n=1 Tax=Desulfonema limicola TaxID=45656 RepID=A0A975B6T1_9BACT|nr:EamA family transporter RarD [Desulfonema limicola]QTA79909.1 DMT superfamily transporter [Desulfonema limicola]